MAFEAHHCTFSPSLQSPPYCHYKYFCSLGFLRLVRSLRNFQNSCDASSEESSEWEGAESVSRSGGALSLLSRSMCSNYGSDLMEGLQVIMLLIFELPLQNVLPLQIQPPLSEFALETRGRDNLLDKQLLLKV